MRKFFNEETKEVIEHLQSDIEKGLTSEEFATQLIEKHQVAVVPGTVFGFMLFSEERIEIEDHSKPANNTINEEHLKMRQLLNQRLIDMDLSVRALNCLKAAEVDTLGELVKYHRSDLLKFRNFGKKSLTELDELLEKNGLAFGMDISRYKLND